MHIYYILFYFYNYGILEYTICLEGILMNKTKANEKYKEAFQTNLRKLCEIYINDKSNNAKSEANVYSDIEEYCKINNLNVFSYIAFKKWLSGASIPDSHFICLLCEFFGCDANYLFAVDSVDVSVGPNQALSKADKYIFDNYGLDRYTLQFFKRYKDVGIDSADDRDAPHLAEIKEQSFSSLFNELIHQSPWIINALLQIIYADRLNLSSYGFPDVDKLTKSYPDYPGISGHLVKDFDMDVAISVLAIRLKQLLLNRDYMPNAANPIETYDAELLKPGAVDEYISNLLSTRLKNLNSEIETLTTCITKEPPIK